MTGQIVTIDAPYREDDAGVISLLRPPFDRESFKVRPIVRDQDAVFSKSKSQLLLVAAREVPGGKGRQAIDAVRSEQGNQQDIDIFVKINAQGR